MYVKMAGQSFSEIARRKIPAGEPSSSSNQAPGAAEVSQALGPSRGLASGAVALQEMPVP